MLPRLNRERHLLLQHCASLCLAWKSCWQTRHRLVFILRFFVVERCRKIGLAPLLP